MERTAGEPVGGPFAVTGTLARLEDVEAFTAGTARLDYGYYRFIRHPLVRELESRLGAWQGVRHVRLVESVPVALWELLLCLVPPGAAGRIVVAEAKGSAPALTDQHGRFLRRPLNDGLSAGLTRGDVLVLPQAAFESGAEGAAATAARTQGAAVISVAPWERGTPAGPALPGVQYWVLDLGTGAAILSNLDRTMGSLDLQLKRRGPTLSSRVAAGLLDERGSPGPGVESGAGAPARVAASLCRMEGGAQALLYASGMSAITRLLETLQRPGRSHVVAVGHLYNDTFESLRPGGATFLGVDEMDALEASLRPDTTAILTESITNPLSDVPDLALLSHAAHARGIPLVVDNTLATPVNCRPFDHGADYVVHSTTKYLNGANDHAGGAVIVREAAAAAALSAHQGRLDDGMSRREAVVLEQNMASFPARMERFNRNGAAAAAFLANHRGVKRLWFNGHPSHRSHEMARRMLNAGGSVVSFTLARDSLPGLRAFYDSPLAGVVKAPSLGSNVTLLCPYTLLTRPNDSDEELSGIGLPRYLVRLSVGCEEDIAPVLASLGDALEAALDGALGAR
jgi:cystathionine gamma-lyase